MTMVVKKKYGRLFHLANMVWPIFKAERKLRFHCFWSPALLTAITIIAFVLLGSPWCTLLALLAAWSWHNHYRKYREIKSDPMILTWIVQEELGGKPRARENCRLWVGNNGICKPLTEERCTTCDGYQKKRRLIWRRSRRPLLKTKKSYSERS